MAETQGRLFQDVGADEAWSVNMKETVATEKDYKDRSRNFADLILAQAVELNNNLVASLGSMNSSMALAAQKQVENVTSVNTTDFVEAQILKSPFNEAIKAAVTTAVTEALAGKKE